MPKKMICKVKYGSINLWSRFAATDTINAVFVTVYYADANSLTQKPYFLVVGGGYLWKIMDEEVRDEERDWER